MPEKHVWFLHDETVQNIYYIFRNICNNKYKSYRQLSQKDEKGLNFSPSNIQNFITKQSKTIIRSEIEQ